MSLPFVHINAVPPLPPTATFDEKLTRGREVLIAVLATYEAQQVAVAFTGGKDSAVALAMWRDTLALDGSSPLRAVSIDTGLKFPQTLEFRDRLCADWNVELTIARPTVDLSTYPVAQDKLTCCRDLKVTPLMRALRETDTRVLISGIRRDEHPSRASRPYAEFCPATDAANGNHPEHWQVNPLLDWSEMDVWAHVTAESLPYCELYHEGYRSLGCIPCTRPTGPEGSERAGRDPEKERQLESLKALGYF
jgi:phosphoadenosine phosphosulfate reductase